MTSASDFGLDEIAHRARDWHTPANANFESLAKSQVGFHTKDISAANATVTLQEAQNGFIVLSGEKTANRTVTLPRDGKYTIVNHSSGAFTTTIIGTGIGDTGVSMQNSSRAYITVVAGIARGTPGNSPALFPLAGLTPAADRLPYYTGVNSAALATFTSFGRDIVGAANQAAGRTVLGLGSAATQNTGTSGTNIPLLSGANNWSSFNTFAAGGSGVVAINRTDSNTYHQLIFRTLGSNRGYIGANSDYSFLVARGSDAAATFHVNQAGDGTFAGAVYMNNPAQTRANLNLGSASIQNTGTSGGVLPFLNGNNTWSGIQAHATQINFGSQTVTNRYDLSRHISLWGSDYGFSVSGGSLNIVSGGVIEFVSGTTNLGGWLANGNFSAIGTVTGASDARLKNDIRDLEDCLQAVLALRPRRFKWKEDNGRCEIGLIAQEVEAVRPDYVFENTDGYKTVAYGNIVCDLIGAVKHLAAAVGYTEGHA